MRGKVRHVAKHHHLNFFERHTAEAGGMKFSEARRVRLRHEYAHLYPEVARDGWLSARKAARLVRSQGPRPHANITGVPADECCVSATSSFAAQ